MNVAEHIARTFADRGITQCFAVAGGHAAFLLDALSREPRINVTFTHHECAAAMAADGYARVAGRPAVVCVSAGPATLNALNGVWGAYVDSVPMIVLSGAPRLETTIDMAELRQLGDQEVVVKPLVAYCKAVDRLRSNKGLAVRASIHEAVRLSTTGRPGPMWVEVPIDVQSAGEEPWPAYSCDGITATWVSSIVNSCQQILNRLRRSERPVILIGSGVRAADALPQFRELVRRLGIPVVTAWAVDAVASDDPHFCGRQGTIGDVGGNRAVQEADFLLILGSRLSIRQVSYNWQSFAPQAFKAWVDVDPAELAKPTVKPDLPVCCDLRMFLDEMLRQPLYTVVNEVSPWLRSCRKRWLDNPVVQPRHREWTGKINPYHFLDVLWSKLADDDVVVCGNATATIMTMQVARIHGEQRLLSNSGAASMGWCLPAAIGAAMTRRNATTWCRNCGGSGSDGPIVIHGCEPEQCRTCRGTGKVKGNDRVICVTGDGSIMQNVQELATIAHNQLPIKVFVLNNGGYGTIKASQRNLLGREVGAGPESGVGFPDFGNLAVAFDIETANLGNEPAFLHESISAALEGDGPFLANVSIDPDQPQEPRLRSRRLPDGSMETASLEEFG